MYKKQLNSLTRSENWPDLELKELALCSTVLARSVCSFFLPHFLALMKETLLNLMFLLLLLLRFFCASHDETVAVSRCALSFLHVSFRLIFHCRCCCYCRWPKASLASLLQTSKRLIFISASSSSSSSFGIFTAHS